jgi:hypothetical protein
MIKIKKEIAIFIVFLILVIFLGIFTKSPNYTSLPTHESVAGLFIQFKDGTTEQEVISILKSYNLPTYTLTYNIDNGAYTYYIKLDKYNIQTMRNELKKKENWTDPVFHDFKKGDFYIIPVTKQAIQDKKIFEMLEKK